MGVLDRDAARQVVKLWNPDGNDAFDRLLDALDGCVRPVPAQTIDRDALLKTIEHEGTHNSNGAAEAFADRILALVRPVKFTVDMDLLDRHAVEIEARTQLPMGYARDSLLRLIDVLKPAVQPVDGVTLTRDEAATCAVALRSETAWTVIPTRWRLLAERLEAAQ